MNNEQLFTYLDEHLVDLRKLPNSDPLWKKVHADKVAKLAWCYVLPMVEWRQLKSWQQRAAKAYALGLTLPRATLVGKTAALIHGIPLITPPKEWEATLPSGSVPQRVKSRNVHYRRTDLRGKETIVHGIRVASLERTALDIARFHGFEEGLVAVDAVRARNVGKIWIDDALGAMGRVKGVAAARQAVATSVNTAESPWESYARALIIAADYPELRWVKAQYTIENYRADLVINGWLVIEIDGNVKYRRDIDEVILAEHRRQQDILNKGFIVLRFSPEQLNARPDYFQQVVGEHLQRGPRR